MNGSGHVRHVVEGVVLAAADWLDSDLPNRASATEQTLAIDNTFTREAIDEAVRLSMSRLTEEALLSWVGVYSGKPGRRVAVLNAGNVPFVGLQDFLAILLTGNEYLGVLSSRSPFLLPAFANSVSRHCVGLAVRFVTLEEAAKSAEVLVATGSSTTTRRVSSFFAHSGIPQTRQLLRGTRTGVAILTGAESQEDLTALAKDVLLHEGRGCRNVSTVLAPRGLDPVPFVLAGDRFRRSFPAHPTTLASVRRVKRFLDAVGEDFHLGDGFVVLQSDARLSEPSVVQWVDYLEAGEVTKWLERHRRLLQVVVAEKASEPFIPEGLERVSFGEAQNPILNWHPDGIDTMAFLRSEVVSGICS